MLRAVDFLPLIIVPAKKRLHVFSTLFVFFWAAQFVYSQTAAAPPSPQQETPTALEAGQQIERELSAKQKHGYRIALDEGRFAAVVVEQRGIDISVVLIGANDAAIAQSDATLKNEGEEKINFTALTTGVYLIEVRAKPRAAAPGRYAIRLAETRPATERERRLEEARKMHNDAIDLYEDGKYTEARALAERALATREKESVVAPDENPDVAASLASLSLIYYGAGDYEKAIQLNERALKIREKVFGTYHQDVARTMHNLGRAYSMVNEYDKAVRVYEKTVEIREKVLGPDSADLSTSLSNLGTIYSNLADYAKAEQLLRRALEIKEKTLAPNSPSIAVSLSNLADVYSARGDEDKALELYRRGLEIREKALRPDHPDIAYSLRALANSHRTKGDYKQAEPLYRRALEILQKALDPEHYRVGVLLGETAILYQMQGDYARAEPLFQRTVTIMEKAVGPDHTDYATALNNLAEFYTFKGDYQKAEPLYQKALAIAERHFGEQHPDVVVYLNNLAGNYQAKGDAAEAVKHWARSRRLSDRHAQLILLTNSERQKLLYFNSLSGETNQFISAHQKFAPANPAALELALTTIFERKGRVSDAVAQEFAALRGRADAGDRALLDKLKETTAQLARKILNGPAQTETPDAHRKQIRELEERKENLEIEIGRRSAAFRAQTQPVTVSSVQAAIPPDAALIEIAVYRPFDAKASVPDADKLYGEPRYVAYVVPARGEVRWTDLGAAKTINEAVEAFRQSLRDPKRKDAPQVARALDEKLMRPLRALTGDKTRLLVSPDGELNLIPFEALVDENGKYLLENYSFTYLTSGRDLLRMQTAATAARAVKNRPLVIADPMFGESPAAQTAKAGAGAAIQKTVAMRGGKKRDGGGGSDKPRSVTATRELTEVYFAPLAGSAQEARSIQTFFPNATFLTGRQATETLLKQTDAPEILHVATHGFFLEDAANPFAAGARSGAASGNARIENPLLRSGLALAGANRRGEGIDGGRDDGILTALEAAALNLWGTKLVVLSACDTGVGEVKTGEGVYGLRRAFVLAGAESVVMSLWPVSDFVTRELMTGFYKNLKQGAGRGASLRQVKLEMMKKSGRQHPFYWAGFIQTGEWAALDGQR